MARGIFILGVNGSPHADGITAQLLNLVLDGAKLAGAQTQLIHLARLRMLPAPGHFSVNRHVEVLEHMPADDLTALYPQILRADGLVLATPVYWANMSGLMKTFIDRLTPLENRQPGLKGKIAAFIAASKENEGGRQMAATAMVTALLQMGVLIPPRGVMWYPSDWKTTDQETDSWARDDAPIVGRNMVALARRLRAHPITWPA